MGTNTKERGKQMDIFNMQCFLSAAEHLNLSKAAIQMHITQPAMSVQIKKLEQEIGVPLFERESRKMVLTPAGHVVQKSFQTMVGTYNTMCWQVKSLEKKEQCLRVGYHGPANWAGITSFFQKFMQENPQVDISIVAGEYGELAQKVRQGKLDVAFLEAAEYKDYETMDWEYLFDDYDSFAMSKDHPLATKTKLTTEDIQGQKICFNMRNSDSMQEIFRKLIQSGIAPENLICVEGTTTSIMHAIAGGGLAAVPSSFKTKENENVVYLDRDSEIVHMRFGLVWRKDNEPDHLIRFVEMAKEYPWMKDV